MGHVGPMKDEYVPAGVPFLRSQNVRENRLTRKGSCIFPRRFTRSSPMSTLQPDDLVVVKSVIRGRHLCDPGNTWRGQLC